MTRSVTTFLWFDTQALPAARHYVATFPRSRITAIDRRGGKVLTVAFELDGQAFIALNGGPHYKLTPAVSMFVPCRDQREIDARWKRLGRGGKPMRCGWIEDRFGLSWQIIPAELPALIRHPAAMQAMLGMVKIDLAALRAAAGAAVSQPAARAAPARRSARPAPRARRPGRRPARAPTAPRRPSAPGRRR